jgi:ketosteroid isomerase-like protein
MRGRGTTWAIIILSLIAAGGIAWYVFYPQQTDEDRILALVAQVERGVEDKAPNRVLSVISDDYQDPFGLRRKDLTILVFRGLRSEGQFKVAMHTRRLRVAGRNATATLEGEVTLSQDSQTLGRYFGNVTLVLRKQGRRWKIVSTRGWQRRALQSLEGM